MNKIRPQNIMEKGYFWGRVPILLVAPRMIALYAHTVLNCYATTDYENFGDFSFGVSRYVLFKVSENSDQIRIMRSGDVSVFEAGVSLPEIEALDALFKELQRLEAELAICVCCGKTIHWNDPVYEDILGQTLTSAQGMNRRNLSKYCLDCLALIQIGGDTFCPYTELT